MVTEGIQSQLSESFGAAAMPFRTLRPSDNHRCSETRRFSLFDVAASARLQLLLQRYELPNVWCGRIEFYGALELEQELL